METCSSFGEGFDHDLGLFPSVGMDSVTPREDLRLRPSKSSVVYENADISPLFFEERYRWMFPHTQPFGMDSEAVGYTFAPKRDVDSVETQITDSMSYFSDMYPFVDIPEGLLRQCVLEDYTLHEMRHRNGTLSNNLLVNARLGSAEVLVHPSGRMMDTLVVSEVNSEGTLVSNLAKFSCNGTIHCIDAWGGIQDPLTFAVCSDSRISVFDVNASVEECNVLDHIQCRPLVLSSRFHPLDRSELVYATSEGKIVLWDLETHQGTGSIDIGDRIWTRFAYQSFSGTIVACGRDKSVLWDPRSERIELDIPPHAPTMAMCLSLDSPFRLWTSTRDRLAGYDLRYPKLSFLSFKQPDYQFPCNQMSVEGSKEVLMGWNTRSAMIYRFDVGKGDSSTSSTRNDAFEAFDVEGVYPISLEGVVESPEGILCLSERGNLFHRHIGTSSEDRIIEDGNIPPSINAMTPMTTCYQRGTSRMESKEEAFDLSEIFETVSQSNILTGDSVLIDLEPFSEALESFLMRPRTLWEVKLFVEELCGESFLNTEFVVALGLWTACRDIYMIFVGNVLNAPIECIQDPCNRMGCSYMHANVVYRNSGVLERDLEPPERIAVKKEKGPDLSMNLDALLAFTEDTPEHSKREIVPVSMIIEDLAQQWNHFEENPSDIPTKDHKSVIFSSRRYYH